MDFIIDNDDKITLAKPSAEQLTNSKMNECVVHSGQYTSSANDIRERGRNYLSTIGPDKIKDYDELCKILSLPNIPRFRSIVDKQKPYLFNGMQVGIYERTEDFSYENNASTLTETADWSNDEINFKTLYRFANQYVGIELTEPKNQFVLFVEDANKKVITFLGVFYVDGLESLRLNKIVLRRVNGNNTQELSLKDLRLYDTSCFSI